VQDSEEANLHIAYKIGRLGSGERGTKGGELGEGRGYQSMRRLGCRI
jgi:hypothetical protein